MRPLSTREKAVRFRDRRFLARYAAASRVKSMCISRKLWFAGAAKPLHPAIHDRKSQYRELDLPYEYFHHQVREVVEGGAGGGGGDTSSRAHEGIRGVLL